MVHYNLFIASTILPIVNGLVTYDLMEGINIGPSIGQFASDLILTDLDGDGDMDLVVARTSHDGLYAAINIADGLFESPFPLLGDASFSSYVYRVGASDLDGDGDNDLVLCVHGSPDYPAQKEPGSVLVALNDGTGGFPTINSVLTDENLVGPTITLERTYCRDVMVADMNGDGKDDIVATTVRSGTSNEAMLVYLENKGSGNFQEPVIVTDTLLGGLAFCAVEDMDRDNLPDIVIGATARDAVLIFYQKQDGSFSPRVVDLEAPDLVFSVSVGDLSGDGLPDIVTHGNEGVNIYQNQGNQAFSKIDLLRYEPPFRLGERKETYQSAVYDVDGDGRNDILLTQAPKFGVNFFEQDEQPLKFSPPVELTDDQFANAFAFADVNEDGLADLIVADSLGNRVFAHLAKNEAPLPSPTNPPPTSPPPTDPPTAAPITPPPTQSPTVTPVPPSRMPTPATLSPTTLAPTAIAPNPTTISPPPTHSPTAKPILPSEIPTPMTTSPTTSALPSASASPSESLLPTTIPTVSTSRPTCPRQMPTSLVATASPIKVSPSPTKTSLQTVTSTPDIANDSSGNILRTFSPLVVAASLFVIAM